MLGLELKIDRCERVLDAMRDRGFLINITQGRVLRFVPALIVTENEINKLVAALDMVLSNFDAEVR